MPTYEWHELPTPARIFFARVLPLMFIAFGVLVCLYVLRTFQDGVASHDWPTVQGTVIESELRGAGDDERLSIVFQFTVEDEQYEESGAVFGTLWRSSQKRDFQRRYPAGSTVAVYYKPSDPGRAVLEPGVYGAGIIRGIGAFGGVFVVAGIFFTLFLPGYAQRSIERAGRGDFDVSDHRL